MTPEQYRREVERYNREVRTHNMKVANAARAQQREIEQYNRKVRAHNSKVENAVKTYNREVARYNFKVAAHNREVLNQRRRLHTELQRLNSRPASVSVTYRQSVQNLAASYEVIEDRLSERADLTDAASQFRNLASAEAANSAYLANALEGDTAADDDTTADDLVSPSVVIELSSFSDDLVSRWTGALFALNPKNPDAARHFCTSAREVLTSIIDLRAPDASVLASQPDCEKTKAGSPTRRSKIRYLLRLKGITDEAMDAFIEADLDNVLELFKMFNGGTHGHAGRFSIAQLAALRNRVETAISFMYRLT